MIANIIENIPGLVVLIVIIAASLIPLVGKSRPVLAWGIAVIAAFLSFIMSLYILNVVMTTGKIRYWFGNWEPPWGIEYVFDPLSAFVLTLVSFVGFIVLVYAKKSLEAEIDPERITYFYALYMLFIGGLMGVVATGDIFNLYVFLEIAAIAGYALIAVGRRREALMASFTYLILGTIAAAFILIGIGYLYMATGTLNIIDLAVILPEIYQSKVVLIAFAFFTVGLSIKIALFPLHNWLPNAYTYAPSVTSIVMAAIATKVGAYVLIRVMFTVFGPEFELTVVHVTEVFLVLSVVAMIIGSVLAIAQTDIKKMLAYSSIAQVGYITLGIALINVTGLTGSIMHILNHAIMKACLFMVVGAIVYRTGITHIHDFVGLGKKMPYTMAAFTIGALSMIGMPLTVGFVGKWYLTLGSLEAGMWYIIPVILVSSLLAVGYLWRLLDNIYFKQPENASELKTVKAKEAPLAMLIPTCVLALLCIVLGTFAYLPISIAEEAAKVLLRY